MAKRLEDLPIYSKAVDFCGAVIAILERPGWRRFRKLHEQISEANDSIMSNMREGFEQGSDREFARFLRYSKGSLAEVMTRLHQGHLKKCVTADELEAHTAAGEALGKMLGGFIKYLLECGWTDRGTFKRTNRR